DLLREPADHRPHGPGHSRHRAGAPARTRRRARLPGARVSRLPGDLPGVVPGAGRPVRSVPADRARASGPQRRGRRRRAGRLRDGGEPASGPAPPVSGPAPLTSRSNVLHWSGARVEGRVRDTALQLVAAVGLALLAGCGGGSSPTAATDPTVVVIESEN